MNVHFRKERHADFSEQFTTLTNFSYINHSPGEGCMRKVACFLMTMLLAVPFIVGAVTWNGDSNQFRWTSGTGVTNDKFFKASEAYLRCVPDFTKGTVTIRYKLPAPVTQARLIISSINGVHIQDFDLQPGSASVTWSYAKNMVAAGIYVASLRYGDVEKNINISIVK
jgi:hypothetical protein